MLAQVGGKVYTSYKLGMYCSLEIHFIWRFNSINNRYSTKLSIKPIVRALALNFCSSSMSVLAVVVRGVNTISYKFFFQIYLEHPIINKRLVAVSVSPTKTGILVCKFNH